MKKLFLFVLLMIPMMLLGQEVVAESGATDLPAWVASLVTFVMGIPKVGPVIVAVIKWLAVGSAILTAISACLQAVGTALVAVGNVAGAQGFVDKVKAISDKILPWLKYFSMFNVQKAK